jgi:hypothetical protein
VLALQSHPEFGTYHMTQNVVRLCEKLGRYTKEEADAFIKELTDERKLMRNTMLKIIYTFIQGLY